MELVSTAEVPAGERFAFWRDLNARLWAPYDLRCERRLEKEFKAHVRISDLGPVQATLITTNPHSINRTAKLIRQADPEVFKLGCVVRGAVMITQDDRSTHYRVGDLKLYDTSRPYLGEFAPDVPVSQVLLLRFPRSLLPLPPRELRHLCEVSIPGTAGVGALSSQFLLQMARHLHELSPSDAARVSTVALDVLTMHSATPTASQRADSVSSAPGRDRAPHGRGPAGPSAVRAWRGGHTRNAHGVVSETV
jgi:hypothetical protein